jgi:hypothetical protein
MVANAGTEDFLKFINSRTKKIPWKPGRNSGPGNPSEAARIVLSEGQPVCGKGVVLSLSQSHGSQLINYLKISNLQKNDAIWRSNLTNKTNNRLSFSLATH